MEWRKVIASSLLAASLRCEYKTTERSCWLDAGGLSGPRSTEDLGLQSCFPQQLPTLWLHPESPVCETPENWAKQWENVPRQL